MEENTIQTTPAEIEQQLQELAPLNVIRTETVLSRLPIHNLAKKGTISIHIVQKDAQGRVDLLWKVSPSRDYGEPRQLAYKLDTIVINRRLDEAGRPVPTTIRLGSLRELAQELEMGSDTSAVRNALHQNASAYITAKLSYKATDGKSRRIETGFARYSVVFTGEQLPDGGKADAVYLILNEAYREVLNNAPFRPLDYDYLRKLPPAAQRFYEILSRKLFAALKFKHATAKLTYSEYCTYSAQRRYFERHPVQNQMNAIHREHKKYGYITEVKYEQTVDSENKPDWIMYYTPGPKARAEYNTFTRSGRIVEISADAATEDVGVAEPIPRRRRTPSRQKRLNLQPETPAVSLTAPQEIAPVLSAMVARGISEARARELITTSKASELLIDQLEWGDEQIRRARPGEIRNPAGFYIHLVSENILPPPGFETSRRRRLREEAQREKQQAQYHQLLLEDAYREYTLQTIAQYVEANALRDEVADLVAAEAKAIRADRRQWPAETIAQFADVKVRERIKERMGTALMTFEAFCQSEQAQKVHTATA